MSTNLIAQSWAQFDSMVIPASAPAVQRQEMRRSFYAGCQSMLSTVVMVSDLPEDQACAVMSKLQGELKDFFDALAKGQV